MASNGKRESRLNPEEVHELLAQGSNEPLDAIFADIIAGAPSLKDIKEFSKTRLDRWSQSAVTIGKMVGRGTPETQVNVFNFQDMSDLEVRSRLKELRGDTATALPPAPTPKSIDSPGTASATQAARSTPNTLDSNASVEQAQNHDKQSDSTPIEPTVSGSVSGPSKPA